MASQMLSWSAIMFAWNARPPHPKYFAGSDWKKTWKERLENASKPWTKKWLEHQTYDEYWVGIQNRNCLNNDYLTRALATCTPRAPTQT